jgi:molybdopterin-guanine dinucleotide biosynthesis protein A
MRHDISGVILAGGLNRRFSGKVKGLLTLGGRRIVERVLGVFQSFFQEVILVTNDPLNYLEYDLFIGADLFCSRSSLTGIHSALFYATRPYAFIAAFDAPFLNPDLLQHLLTEMSPAYDVIIPETSKGLEPLCAIYSKRCFGAVETQLRHEDLRIRSLFRKVRVKIVSEPVLRKADPNLYSFFNVNRPEDLLEAEAILKEIENGGVHGHESND